MAPTPFRVIRGTATGKPNGEPTDAEIAESLRRGERQAELEAWNRFSPGAAQTLRRLLGPGPDREDLLQEVFLRFYKRIGTLREPAAVRGFLFGICVRVVQGELVGRHRRRWLRLTPTGEPPETAREVPNERTGLCASCQHSETVTSVRGSTFSLCRLSASDPRFPKYPPLPVLACDGYARQR